MNCVVEKRKAEEMVDPVPALPFGLNLLNEPRKTKVTGERLAIICESNVEPTENEDDKQEIHIRQFIVPFAQTAQQQMPIPYGAMPNFPGPMTHMPMRVEQPQEQSQAGPSHMMPHPIISRLFVQRPQQFNVDQPPIPPQVMQAPPVQQPQIRMFQPMRNDVQPPPQVRIQLHRIAIPNSMQEPQMHEQQQQNQAPQMQVQQVPLAVALAKAGITPEDLNNIRKIAEVKFQQEMNRFMEAENEDTQSESSERTDDPIESNQESQSSNEEANSNILPIGRLGFARSLLKPVSIPIQMMPNEAQENTNENPEQTE